MVNTSSNPSYQVTPSPQSVFPTIHPTALSDSRQYLLTISPPEVHVQPYHPARQPLSTSIPSLPYPLSLRSLGKEDYFTIPTGLNLLGMLKNPMVLMMMFSGIMMFAMPKVMVGTICCVYYLA